MVLARRPSRTVANWFWPDGSAPWEKVDAYFYAETDRYGLFKPLVLRELADVSQCQSWVGSMAEAYRDPMMARSDYECGIGKPRDVDGMSVYRLTVK